MAGSHFYILLFFAGIPYIRVILKSSIFQVDKEIKMLSQYIFLTQINQFFREKEVPFQVIEARRYEDEQIARFVMRNTSRGILYLKLVTVGKKLRAGEP